MPKDLIRIPGHDILEIVEDGLKQMEQNGCNGFRYKIGEVRGGALRVVFEPDEASIVEYACIDEFALTLVAE